LLAGLKFRASYATAGRHAKIDWKVLSKRVALILGGALTSAEVTKDVATGQADGADGGEPGVGSMSRPRLCAAHVPLEMVDQALAATGTTQAPLSGCSRAMVCGHGCLDTVRPGLYRYTIIIE
jgi:hypothetical protein